MRHTKVAAVAAATLAVSALPARAQFIPPRGLNLNTTIYAGQVSGATITTGGVYKPADLPVTITFDAPSNGESVAASVSSYGVVAASVAASGTGCPAGIALTDPDSGATFTVSDGDGGSGSTVTITSGGSVAASGVPSNPVTLTSTLSSCTPPTVTLLWGVSGLSLTNQGWGYASAPSGVGRSSSAVGGVAAAIKTTISTAETNLAAKLITSSKIGTANGVAALDSGGNITAPVTGDLSNAKLSSDMTGSQAVTAIADNTTAAAAAQSTANTATTAAAAAQTTASAAIPLTQKGVASGVAGLDTSGNVTAPVSTTGQIHAGSDTATTYNAGKISIAAAQRVSIGDDLGYGILDNRSVMLGGRRYGGSSPTFVYAAPYGGSGLGATFGVGLTKSGIGGAQPALAPSGTDGSGGISGYPEMDAAATWIFADSSYPWVSVGGDITSGDGTVRTVTYDSTHAYFSPSLAAQDIALLRVGMHVMTNSVGSTRTNATKYWQPNNDYAGEITAIASDGSSITVGGWRVLGAGDTDTTQVPGTTYDTTMWPTYTHADLFMGVYTHAISNNSMCFLEARSIKTSGDANSPEVGLYPEPVTDCEIAEMDLHQGLPDYMGRAKGILVTMNGPNKPSLDSYDFMAGGSTWNGYVAWNGTKANNFISDGFYAHGNNGVNSGLSTDGTVVVGTAGDTHELAEFIGASAVQPDGSGSGDKISLVAYESLIAASTNMGANTASNVALHWSELVGGTTTLVSTLTGGDKVTASTAKGDVVFNADAAGGLGLFGGSSGAGLHVNSSGAVTADSDVHMTSGKALFFPNASSTAAVYLTADSSGNFNIGTQQSGGGGLSLAGGLKVGGAAVLPFGTPASSSATCTAGQVETDATYIYSCVATNTWHRIANGATW
ncbi:hypothetical protein [Acetobacter sp. DsW_063]|uniref:hypothetical protein n=1 Tax=Acetobacter sp. DsW_063 TaxID=1514894 RepID=UPI000A38B035|nr:hypothetical protein [Acetobacter sp. DsW_063]OUJ16478.1 hypothetical protein HK28_12420 [Acetobacter sp. DsW_063]